MFTCCRSPAQPADHAHPHGNTNRCGCVTTFSSQAGAGRCLVHSCGECRWETYPVAHQRGASTTTGTSATDTATCCDCCSADRRSAHIRPGRPGGSDPAVPAAAGAGHSSGRGAGDCGKYDVRLFLEPLAGRSRTRITQEGACQASTSVPELHCRLCSCTSLLLQATRLRGDQSCS